MGVVAESSVDDAAVRGSGGLPLSLAGSNSSGGWELLLQNCRSHWPPFPCVLGNSAGLFSTVLWFIVLVPQLWKNYRRGSVHGLSVLWATANFTAAFINAFFVFSLQQIPYYTKISAVYMPSLEAAMMIQFGIYCKVGLRQKLAFGGLLMAIVTTVLVLCLGLQLTNEMEWVAIFLWSVQTFPQVMLNSELRSTSGQATTSVLIAVTGKTSDFLTNYLLIMPTQYVVMSYFSSTLGYINGIQLVLYYRRHASKREPTDDEECKDVTEKVPVLGEETGHAPPSGLLAALRQRSVDESCCLPRMVLGVYLLATLAVFAVCVAVCVPWYLGVPSPLVVIAVLASHAAFRARGPSPTTGENSS